MTGVAQKADKKAGREGMPHVFAGARCSELGLRVFCSGKVRPDWIHAEEGG